MIMIGVRAHRRHRPCRAPARDDGGDQPGAIILPPSEIDLGLCLAVFAGSGGKHLFHRIG